MSFVLLWDQKWQYLLKKSWIAVNGLWRTLHTIPLPRNLSGHFVTIECLSANEIWLVVSLIFSFSDWFADMWCLNKTSSSHSCKKLTCVEHWSTDQPRTVFPAKLGNQENRRWHIQSWSIHKQSNAVAMAANQWVSILNSSQTEAIQHTCSSSVCRTLTNVPAWRLTPHCEYLYSPSLTKLMVESIVDQNVRANAAYHPWFYCSQYRRITQCQRTVCFKKGILDN